MNFAPVQGVFRGAEASADELFGKYFSDIFARETHSYPARRKPVNPFRAAEVIPAARLSVRAGLYPPNAVINSLKDDPALLGTAQIVSSGAFRAAIAF